MYLIRFCKSKIFIVKGMVIGRVRVGNECVGSEWAQAQHDWGNYLSFALS